LQRKRERLRRTQQAAGEHQVGRKEEHGGHGKWSRLKTRRENGCDLPGRLNPCPCYDDRAAERSRSMALR
jgi:hypothetical protein